MGRSSVAVAAVLFLGVTLCIAGASAVGAPEPPDGTPPSPAVATQPPAEDRSFETLPQAKEKEAHVERFSGKLVLVLLDDKDHPSIRGGRSLWAVERPLSYRPSGADYEISVPPGFVTDLASIPRLSWSLLPPDGPWAKAAVIHDFLYKTKGTGVWKGHPSGNTRPEPYTRAEADGILREAMQDRGVDVVRRNIIWAAVRLGGAGGWGS